MQSVGIELILKENLADRLGKILPILEKMDKTFSKLNQVLSVTEASQKRVDQQFKNIARSVDTVASKERGLRTINTGVQNIEKTTRAAAGATGLLGNALQGLQRYLAPLLGLVGVYKAIQGIGILGGEGISFEKNVSRLQVSQYTPAQRRQAEQKAIDLAQSGKYAMTGSQNLDYVLRGGAISADKQGVIDSMELMNKTDMAMRKLKVEDALEGNSPLVMNQIWEKLGDRTTKQKQETADLLAQYEGYYAGQVPLSQFSRQLQRTRGAKLGAAKEGLFGQLFHGISEQITAGGGGGGQGGVGQGYLALDTVLGGKMSKEMQATWDEAGLLPGLHKFLKNKAGHSGSDTVVYDKTGMHHTGRSGSSATPKYDFRKYLANAPPDWYDLAAEDQRAFMQGPLKSAIERRFHLKSGSFSQQKAVEQKRMVRAFFPGSTQNAIGQVIENITGRYADTVAAQQAGVKKQPGVEGVLKAQTSIEDRWAQLFNSFTALGSALGNNEKLVKDANQFINALTQAIQALNKNVQPIADSLDYMFKLGADPLRAPGVVGQDIGTSIRGAATKGWHGILDMARGQHNLVSSPGGVLDPSDFKLNPVSNLPVHDLTPKGFATWSDEKRSAWIVQHADDLSAASTTTTKSTAITKVPPPSPALAGHPPDARQSQTHKLFTEFMKDLHIDIDVKGVPKHLVETTVRQVNKTQLKTLNHMSQAAAQAGGSHTPSSYNAGGEQ